ncbi:mitochondrial sodium/calcium exchanger protein-like [Brevipalpus obovatus]|uniref:mitochondrial sodium/calcium exchanger protein-like n=1 Tax=Brevipalpus obovatus TaxID=246614 RepID=UPI003D9DEB5A
MWLTSPVTIFQFQSPTHLNISSEQECLDIHYYNSYDERCSFVQLNRDCNSTLSLIDYNRFLYCGFQPERTIYGIIICIVWALILFLALAVVATDFLCPALFLISKTLGLSQNVAGVTLVAFGNGSVDIFAAITGMRQGRPDLVIGDLLGGGIFVILFVIGNLFAIKPFKLSAIPFIRDMVFYFIGVTWIFYLFVGSQAIRLYDALGLLALYLIYVATVIILGKFDKSPGSAFHGHSSHHGKSDSTTGESVESNIEFEGISPDVDPDEEMVVMKGFVMKTERLVIEPVEQSPDNNNTIHRSATYPTVLKPSNLPSVIPIIKVSDELEKKASHTELSGCAEEIRKKCNSRVSIFEDNSAYSTVTSVNDVYATRSSKRSRASSIFSLSPNQVLQIRRASREFLEKITPIDVMRWKRKNWGNRTLEVIKSPIRLFLLLTTPMADPEDKGEWNKLLSALHCITGPLFVVYALGFGGLSIYDKVPLPAIVFVVASIIALLLIFTSKFETPPKYYRNYSAYLAFVIGVTWIYTIANECVSIIRTLGLAFSISEIAVGMTLLAVGNCFLDFVANVAIAKRGYPRMAVAACIGAPLLSLLIGVGVPTSIKLISNPGTSIPLQPSPLIVIIYAALSVTIWLTIIVSIISKFKATRSYGIFLVVVYCFLIAFVFLVEWKIVNLSFLSF